MRIHELSQLSGLSVPTIRYYESLGVLDGRHVSRSSNNYRVYTDEALVHLRRIQSAQSAGLTLAEFRETEKICQNPDTAAGVSQFLARKLDELNQKEREIQQTRAFLLEALANVPIQRLERSGRQVPSPANNGSTSEA